MDGQGRILPISRAVVVVEQGTVRLNWLRNDGFFTGAPTTPEEEYRHFRIWRKRVACIEDCDAFYVRPYGLADAVCVYDGAVAETDTGFYWCDAVSEPEGSVAYYVYFLASHSMEPLELRPVAVRNRQLWWSYTELDARLNALHKTYPAEIGLTTCGQTTMGRKIPRLMIGRGDKALALVGLIHAGESGPELIVPVLERLLAQDVQLLRRVRVIAIPSVNIDQREKMVRGFPYYLRTNASGVDINRNFPACWEEVDYAYQLSSDDPESATYRGVAPGSAPETRAVMAGLDDAGLAAVFSFHWLNGICALPALSCTRCQDNAVYVEQSRRLVEAYSAGLYPERAYEPWFHGLQASAGSLPAWAFQQRGVPGFDLEGGTLKLGYGATSQQEHTPALLVEYIERHYRAVRNVLRSLADL